MIYGQKNQSFPTDDTTLPKGRRRVASAQKQYFHVGGNFVASSPHLVHVDVGCDQTAYRFSTLASVWESATRNVSSVSSIASHPAYLQIIALGKSAVPLILQRMESAPNHWFPALEALTGENPVPDNKVGDMNAMRKAWQSWGRRHGYVE